MATDDPKRAPPPAGGRGAAVVAGGCTSTPCPGGETAADRPFHVRATDLRLDAARHRAAGVALLAQAAREGRRAVALLEASAPGADEAAAAQAVTVTTANVQQALASLANANALLARVRATEQAALAEMVSTFPARLARA